MIFKKRRNKACLSFVGDTHVGKVRKNNQDYYYTPKPGDKVDIAIVADGMGGYKGGDVASQLCVNTIVRLFNSKYTEDTDIEELLYECVNAANIAVYDRSSESEYLRGMGTTVVLAAFVGKKVYILNVGDSRAYHINKDNKVKQITNDHTLVQEYINIGKITKQQARTHNYRHVITRAIGTDKRVMIDLFRLELKAGERILLCSDGMYEYVDCDMIEEIMSKVSSEKMALKKIMDISLSSGGADNVTVVIVKNKERE